MLQALANLGPGERAMLQTLSSLSAAQVAALPPAVQQQLQALLALVGCLITSSRPYELILMLGGLCCNVV